MIKNPLRSLLAGLFLIGSLTAAAGVGSATDIHFALSKSEPEADASVEAPAEVRLWFTEEPQDGTVSVRVLDASEEQAMTMDVTQSEDDARSFAVAFHHPPAAGTYTVAWRGIGSDGHVVRDTFTFTVTAQ